MIDIIIIGAGPSGLCAAKTFLQHDEDVDLLVLDANPSLGGVWSKELLYPTLKTNNLYSAMDFFNFPLDEKFGNSPGEHISGESMNAYLNAYAAHFQITPKIQFSTRVEEVSRDANARGWRVRAIRAGKNEVIQCRKLVVATGILSVPHVPDIEGAEEFAAPFLHSSEMGPRADEVCKNPDIKTVAVLGGCKSAYDAVYLAASTGHKVDWIIRKSGRGPTWVFPPHTFLGPFKAWRERLLTRRFLSFMSPWVFPDFSGVAWLRNFLHFNPIGKLIPQNFWKLIHVDNIRDCEYKTDPRFKVLEPEQNPFWYGTASGTLNYDMKFLSYIQSGQVRVHREDIGRLSCKTIHLAEGTCLDVDALIASTGYSAKPTIKFSPCSLHSDLGIPTTAMDASQSRFWQEQETKADLVIGAQFPRLLRGPARGPDSSTPVPFNAGASAEVDYSPWRLYRGIAPPGFAASGDHSLVFLGMMSNIANTIRLEIQCVWALAYMNHQLPSVDADAEQGKIFEESALLQRFSEMRSPYGHGRFYPDFTFDQMPYWDVLLNDLGLETHRKANIFRELFEPYTQKDYEGILEEWLSRDRK